MAIHGRWGGEVTIVRVAELTDVKKYENRKPDAHDKKRVEQGCYLIVADKDDPTRETLQEVAYMRADDGLREIAEAIRKTSEHTAWAK